MRAPAAVILEEERAGARADPTANVGDLGDHLNIVDWGFLEIKAQRPPPPCPEYVNHQSVLTIGQKVGKRARPRPVGSPLLGLSWARRTLAAGVETTDRIVHDQSWSRLGRLWRSRKESKIIQPSSWLNIMWRILRRSCVPGRSQHRIIEIDPTGAVCL